MARQITAGIDIGTSAVRVIVAEKVVGRYGAPIAPTIIGTGTSPSRGVSRGYITNIEEASRSVESAVRRAEKVAGTKIKQAFVSFGGIGLASTVAEGTVAISKADMEVTDRDVAGALEAAEGNIPRGEVRNRRIINTVPIEYKIDGEKPLGQVVGLRAAKLEAKVLFITCLEHHLSNLIDTVENAGVEVVDVVAGPVAASFVALSKKQKKVGCVLADIGAETTSVVVFEDNNLISLEVLPLGGNDITNEIALGMKVSLEEAEATKLDIERSILSAKKKLASIISSKLTEIFGAIHSHLKSIGRDALLPGGSILIGGGAGISVIKGTAETSLKLPSQIGEVHFGGKGENKVKDRSWAVACGLSIVGFNSGNGEGFMSVRGKDFIAESSRRWGRAAKRWVSQFLP